MIVDIESVNNDIAAVVLTRRLCCEEKPDGLIRFTDENVTLRIDTLPAVDEETVVLSPILESEN